MTAQTSIFNRKPTHLLYCVTGEGDNAFWRRIGAAWQHRDGKGFSVDCGLIPLTGRLVMREAKEPEASNQSAEPKQAKKGARG